MKLTRRQWAALAALAPAAKTAAAQAPSLQPPSDDAAAARENLKRNADALRKIAVPMDTEPAFLFKP